MSLDELKRIAAKRAAEMVQSGMVLGLGSGTTSWQVVLALGERVRAGELRAVVGVPTSEKTAALAREQGIPLTTLDDHPQIDFTLDGADEVAPNMDVIKGLGGYLLREKLVALATRRLAMVVDHTKIVPRLGVRSPVPVEVVRFAWRQTREALERTGAQPRLRMTAEGQPWVTDEGHYILDCAYARIDDPPALAAAIKAITGVVEHGLFLGMVRTIVVAAPEGIAVVER